MFLNVRLNDIDFDEKRDPPLTPPSVLSFRRPIVACLGEMEGKTFRCVDGHRRLVLLRSMELETVEIFVPSFTFESLLIGRIDLSRSVDSHVIIIARTPAGLFCVKGANKIRQLTGLGLGSVSCYVSDVRRENPIPEERPILYRSNRVEINND